MKRGYLSEYFDGVAIKRLAAVDIDVTRSHQHEIGTVKAMRSFMGLPVFTERWPTRFIYMDDESDEPLSEEATVTYYDVRAKNPDRSPEPRFYFPTTQVTQSASVGDLLVIAKCKDGRLLFIFAENESSAARQLEWLFGFSDDLFPTFSVRSELETEKDRIGLSATFILETIGVEVVRSNDTFLDEMLRRFNGSFPNTRQFSEFARESLGDVDPRDDPDGALMAWMEREEILFRTLERHFLADWLQHSFRGDVDDFMKTSLSVQNRRKSRVGYALENHFEVILQSFGKRYQRTVVTENKAKPDFLFPSQMDYQNPEFPADQLFMLGVKSTCKDRWRQVLSEADRISRKHLMTLESAISENQTEEMKAKNLQLVVPRSVQGSYKTSQTDWLMDLSTFLKLL
ncbi:type II restriction endonuclease [Dyella humicola]|uniref:type II restriction endonuclease n=1 Tax=Dyella humicola TaxID=2992126 RepID=UPI0022507865|nr:type II restriction endonuclease [Dyella humicola]